MSITQIFNQLFNAQVDNQYFEIRKDAFLLDTETHQHFLKNGWCKLSNVVAQKEIDSFTETFNEISKIDGFVLDDHFQNTGCGCNPAVRSKTQDFINQNVSTILPRIFNMEKVSAHTGGTYQVKPASPVSELEIHQDSTVVDEEKDYCIFLWIPLCEITETNGPIWVLPGSHLWGNTQRSLGVPWHLMKHIDILRKYMFPVTVKLGDALIFDPALVHGSTPNFSKETRHSITITVLRKNYQLVYFFKDKKTNKDSIEKYEVDETFYETYDFVARPDESKWKKEIVKYKPFDLSQKELVQLIETHLPK